ncbi:MAG: Rrf2 family transcriptional regulator [Spirochaetes bacterium]|nr:Rrf2 family transcriptional regulator [Spirochaetota bacterium]MBU1081461.1 Rrf2 family transcriptional regulator [Spirochaetota bacterium]
MRITTKGRYALRAAIALARLSSGTAPVSIKTLSEAESLSPEFLEQIFFKLRKAGLISSVRGPGGGFFFAKPLSEILLRDIVSASGEGMFLSSCSGPGTEDGCDRVADCVAGSVWKELAAHIDSFLVSMTLQDIVARSRPRDLPRAPGR